MAPVTAMTAFLPLVEAQKRAGRISWALSTVVAIKRFRVARKERLDPRAHRRWTRGAYDFRVTGGVGGINL